MFVLEDNGIACGTTVERHSADPDLVNRGRGYGMPCHGLDGNDVEQAVARVAEAAMRARVGRGPTYLVAKTFRFRGFTMSDAMRYRTRAQAQAAQERDPIRVYARQLIERGLITAGDLEHIAQEADDIVEDAARFAEESPDPTPAG